MLLYSYSKGNQASSKKGGKRMGEIEKALKDLEKALKNNDSVARVTVTIMLVKPKTNKGEQKD